MDFTKKYDVVVVGGGIAGVAAALQAARCGKKTALLEKTVMPGGLATTGLIYVYLPLCDGKGKRVTFGLSEELLRLSIKYGPGEIPPSWHENIDNDENKRYTVFSPASFIIAMDEILGENGVDIWYDTLVCGVTQNDKRKITGVIVENASGRGLVEAECFIDSSGECAVARRAGCEILRNDNCQSIWALEYNRTHNRDIGFGERISRFFWGHLEPEDSKDSILYSDYSGKTVSKSVLDGRAKLRESLQKNYDSGQADRYSRYPLTLAAMPHFRKIYCIDGSYVLKAGEDNRHFEDSIGMAADWRESGPVWEIPYRTLIPSKPIGGLLAAGRCTAAAGDAWEITRVIPVAAMTGQVAGLAAALSIDAGVEPYELEVEALQRELRNLGFKLHLPEIGLNYR